MKLRHVCAFVLTLTVLPACSTLRGWFGLAEAPAVAPPESNAAVARGIADDRAAAVAARSAREQEIRQEIRRLEAGTKSGSVPVREARRRIDELKAELEDVVRADAAARAAGGRPGRTADAGRAAGTDARLDRIEARLAEIERRLDALSR